MSLLYRASCFLALALISVAAAANDEPKQIVIDAAKTTSAPKLDGVLDDECWKGLPEYTSFVDGDTRAVLKCQTTAKICCDESYIYVAFHAMHPNPAKIKAEETKRNGGGFRRDDFVAVNIDSLHTHREQSYFDVNAIGTQSESLQRSASTNIEYKGDWRGAAKIVGDGYTVEMAIPFSLLVYDAGQDAIGISFRRNMADDNIWAVWPDLNGTNDLKYYAHFKGLKLPDTELRPKILSYVMAQRGSDTERGNYQGMDIKYPFSSGSVGVLSINPDFNTIEQQVESVDFSYTERYLEDARPFFSEWEVPVDSRTFYSRRIRDFETGLKYAGSSGPNTFGIMNMRTPGEANDTVLSAVRNVGNQSSIQFCMADHQTPGHRNTVQRLSTDIAWSQGQRTSRVSTGYYACDTTGLPDGHVRWVNVNSYGAPGAINYYYDYGIVDKEWNGELGYSTTADTRGNYWGLWRETAERGGNLQSIYTELYFYDRNRINGTHYKRTASGNLSFYYVDGHSIELNYMRQRYEQFHEEVPTVTLGWNNNAKNRNGSMQVCWGDKAGGDYLLTWAKQKFRIGRNAALGLEWNREYIGDTSPYAGTRRQVIVTANYDLSSERSLGGRIVTQQGDNNVFFMYRQQVRHGTDAYLIYGDPNASNTDGKVSLKMVRTL